MGVPILANWALVRFLQAIFHQMRRVMRVACRVSVARGSLQHRSDPCKRRDLFRISILLSAPWHEKNRSILFFILDLLPSREDVFLLTFNETISQISCGSKCTLVLGISGLMWGCGMGIAGWENESTEDRQSLVYYSPHMLKCVKDKDQNIAMLRICCGVSHCLALASRRINDNTAYVNTRVAECDYFWSSWFVRLHAMITRQETEHCIHGGATKTGS